MSIKRKIVISVSVALSILVFLLGANHLVMNALFGGSGPSPRLVLEVSSDEHELTEILAIIESIDTELGSRINKKESSPEYPYYKHAYWYPINNSNKYGIALVEWDTSYLGNDDLERNGKYFIHIYSDSRHCKLCSLLKSSLLEANVKFSSPCEDSSELNEYEKSDVKSKYRFPILSVIPAKRGIQFLLR